MADPARKMEEAPAPQEAPKSKGSWGAEGLSLAESEQKGFEAGHEALTGKKMELDKQVEDASSSFKASTTSWWQKTKTAFGKAKSWVRGEEEIRKLDEHIASLKASYQKKAETVVAPDNIIDLAAERAKREGAPPTEAQPADVAGEDALNEALASGEEKLKHKETLLSAEYDRLAAEVAHEGASEKKVQKWAMKEGLNIGPTSEASQRLNQVYKELQAERAEMAKPKPAAAEARADEEEPFTPEELAALKAGGAELAREKRIAEMGARVDAAMAVEDEKGAMEAVASLEAEAAAEKMAERLRQWDADKAEHERQRNEKLAAREAAKPLKSPRETYPDLPQPVPGTLPPGVPDHRQPAPTPEKPEETPVVSGEIGVEAELPEEGQAAEESAIEGEEPEDKEDVREAAREAKERMSEWAELHDTPTMIAKRLEKEGAQHLLLADVAILPLVMEDLKKYIASDEKSTGPKQLLAHMKDIGVLDGDTAKTLSKTSTGLKMLRDEVVSAEKALLERLEKIQKDVPKEAKEGSEKMLRAEKTPNAYRVSAKDEEGRKFLDGMPKGFWRKENELKEKEAAEKPNEKNAAKVAEMEESMARRSSPEASGMKDPFADDEMPSILKTIGVKIKTPGALGEALTASTKYELPTDMGPNDLAELFAKYRKAIAKSKASKVQK